MKFIASKQALVAALDKVCEITKKGTDAVWIRAGEGAVMFNASNGSVRVQSTILVNKGHVKLESPGEVLVKGEDLRKLLKTFSEAEFVLERVHDDELKRDMLRVEAATGSNSKKKKRRSQFHLEFAKGTVDLIEPFTHKIDVSVNMEYLSHAFGIHYCASKDDSRPVLKAVKIDAERNGLSTWATDSSRLSVRFVPSATEILTPITLLPDAEDIEVVLRLFMNWEKDIRITADDRCLCFSTNDLVITLKLIDGQYPEVRKIFPDRSKAVSSVSFARMELINTLDRARVMCSAKNFFLVRMTFENSVFKVRSTLPDRGSFEETMNVVGTGEIDIQVNVKHLMETLQHSSADSITLYFMGSQSGFLIDGRSEIGLIMPVVA